MNLTFMQGVGVVLGLFFVVPAILSLYLSVLITTYYRAKTHAQILAHKKLKTALEEETKDER